MEEQQYSSRLHATFFAISATGCIYIKRHESRDSFLCYAKEKYLQNALNIFESK